ILSSPWVVGHLLKLVPNDVAKVRLLSAVVGGMRRAELEEAARTFADRVEGWLRPGALERVRWHVEQGHDVLLVSASLDLWVGPWAERHGLRLLSTRGRWEGEVFTGQLETANCHGPEKVRRIREVVDPDAYETRYGYGDSSGDAEMLAICDEVSFRPFR
ncbi:MAG: HAD-IB family hydrolase, partial [Myxococcales bacterium]|nr:HAD-IB family hydrolase [Myxococcales bacterium]